MGQNSTEVTYGFGQFGSTFLKGDGAKLLLTASTAKYYVCAITMITDVTFQALESLDGGVNMGMGDTAFVGTETLAIDTMWNAAAADTTNETNEDSDPITTSDTFPKGVTIYGMWDNVELNGGSAIVYVAPRPDYHNRA
jgi:hypothetical protein|tara:strand:- start:233 stop:649 length:417 start_codon:yes stop_codon:yes gene_type:complete